MSHLAAALHYADLGYRVFPCVVGGKVASAIGHKAEAGARTIYEFISTKLNETPTPAAFPAPASRMASGAAPRIVPVSATGSTGPSQPNGTLMPADLQPVWHAPVPLPPRREARASRPSA